jgi:hypothetical protein
MIRVGTNRFRSIQDAVRYYAAQGETQADVQQKLNDGEIRIGAPQLKANESVTVDSDGRFFIIEQTAVHKFTESITRGEHDNSR